MSFFNLGLLKFLSIMTYRIQCTNTSLVKFIPKYIILFDVILNGIVFLISFSKLLHNRYTNNNKNNTQIIIKIDTQIIFIC